MASSDAFVIGEDWISEHYFTSDATNESFHSRVLARRKEWDAEEGPTARSRFTEQRADLERRLGALTEDPDRREVEELYADLVRVLGYRTGEFELETEGPLTAVSTPGLTGAAPLVVLAAKPVETVEDLLAKDAKTLLEPVEQEDGTSIESVARMLSSLFVADEGPAFALVLAGRWCLVAERERWPEGRYLAVDLQLVAERNDAKRGGEVDRALACLSARSLGPDADGSVWWSEVLEESIKHTVGVSEDLREGVRRSIEIIANEVVDRRRAQGLDPLPPDQAQPLAVQSLRYLYRILFLLYAEASPELGVLPTGASEYDAGYGIDRLRELTLVELHTQQAREGTHLYESIRLLTDLVDRGHTPSADAEALGPDGLRFNPLRADLFRPEATAHIDAVGLGNAALKQVLEHLLISKERKGKERGFISYVELGINQLGAVYEGLMSYTGFFAGEDLFEVAKNGDPSKGSWVVPVDRADHLDEKDFVREEDPLTGEERAVRHPKGSFVFRLAGRERQQSASYYTPEVLTRFTVQQALEELLDQDGQRTTAEEILGLSVCEPALGSGAFALEAVDQLAREYLSRRQDELGVRIDPDEFPKELQKVKAHIALHQVYGVDLNATAVELAEVSLWLSTMVEGLQAPWFGLRLRRGNSLVGARHAVYPAADVRSKAWLTSTPADVPLTTLAQEMEEGGVGNSVTAKVFHFLLPAQGWGSAVEVPKQVRDLAPDEVKALKSWRSSMRRKPTKQQVDRLLSLTQRAEQLWQISLRRLRIAEAESSRNLDLWGRHETPDTHAVSREQIEASLADEDGAYRRLRRVMDAWCALWFWPLSQNEIDPPSFEEWLDALTMLLGTDTRDKKRAWMDTFQDLTDWHQLGEAEEQDRIYSGAVRVEEVLGAHPWLDVCEDVATRQAFFHWELDFATQFGLGGFDLQVGNPPWVRPEVKIDELLAEGDPWWLLADKRSEADEKTMLRVTWAQPGFPNAFLSLAGDLVGARSFLGDGGNYPDLQGLQVDLYRAFMVRAWNNSSAHGRSALIHLESHFTDDDAATFRRGVYGRLLRHWQFNNELKFFEIGNKRKYSVNVYRPGAAGEVRFLHAVRIHHPDTIVRSLVHDGSGSEPGVKFQGEWDLRPHSSRIQVISAAELAQWARLISEDLQPLDSPMIYTSNSAVTRVLGAMSLAPRVADQDLAYDTGFNETGDARLGFIERKWGQVELGSAVIQGPHVGVSNPLYQVPNRGMKSHRDWQEVDLESLGTDWSPVVGFQATKRGQFKALHDSTSTLYRTVWRRRVDVETERTLSPALIPPRLMHINALNSAGAPLEDVGKLVAFCGSQSSLLLDLCVRVLGKADLRPATVARLPMIDLGHPLVPFLQLRTLQLNCLTAEYSDLWEAAWCETFLADRPVLGRGEASRRISATWNASYALRIAEERRNAQVEMDALVALIFDIAVDDLCAIYRSEFGVLVGYDARKYTFDASGRVVPTEILAKWRRGIGDMSPADRTWVHPESSQAYTFELPYRTLDREADMRTAYAEFERRLAEMDS